MATKAKNEELNIADIVELTDKLVNKKIIKRATKKKVTKKKIIKKTTKKKVTKKTTKKKVTKKKALKKGAIKSIYATVKKGTKKTKLAKKQALRDSKPEGYVFGRPSKYKKGMAEKWLKLVEDGNTLIEASHLMHLDYNTVTDWASKHDDFLQALAYAHQIAANKLAQYGLNGVYNPQMAMFLLKCNHGMLEAHQKKSLQLKEKELDAKISGDLPDGTDVHISFGIAPKPEEA